MVRIKFRNNRAISSVVATSLLLVVAVMAVVFFQGWFKSFSSNMLTDVQMKSQYVNGALSIGGLVSDILYVKNGVFDNLSMSSINIGDVVCNITGQEDLRLGMNEIDISSCLDGVSGNVQDIVLVTGVKIIDKTVYIDDIILASCSLGGVSINSGSSGIFYNSSVGSVCYSQSRSCTDGVLAGNSSYNESTCSVLSSSLTCVTDDDSDGQILWSCAKYPMTNLTNEGDLDVNDLNVTVVDDKCWLKGDKSSCESNFVVGGCGTGTVLDVGTGLCWQQNMSSYLDYGGTTLNWTEAKDYCSGLGLSGQTWGLPTKEELMTLTDLSRSSPAIVGGNNKFSNVITSYYWTMSTYASTAGAWRVGFNDGNDNFGVGKTSSNYVTCVVRH